MKNTEHFPLGYDADANPTQNFLLLYIMIYTIKRDDIKNCNYSYTIVVLVVVAL